MDILRKEINAIYDAQKLDVERLPYDGIGTCLRDALNVSRVTDGCAVITDAARDCCHIFAGNIATVLGLSSESNIYRAEFSSGDEDIIYNRLHPEDLVEKRMLEYEFFKFVDRLSPEEKTIYRAACRLRLRDKNNRYILIDNTTRIHRLSPAGKIWLILCTYDISALSDSMPGIHASIINGLTGDVRAMNFDIDRSGKGDSPAHTRRSSEQGNCRQARNQHIYCQPPPSEHSLKAERRQLYRSHCRGNSYVSYLTLSEHKNAGPFYERPGV